MQFALNLELVLNLKYICRIYAPYFPNLTIKSPSLSENNNSILHDCKSFLLSFLLKDFLHNLNVLKSSIKNSNLLCYEMKYQNNKKISKPNLIFDLTTPSIELNNVISTRMYLNKSNFYGLKFSYKERVTGYKFSVTNLKQCNLTSVVKTNNILRYDSNLDRYNDCKKLKIQDISLFFSILGCFIYFLIGFLSIIFGSNFMDYQIFSIFYGHKIGITFAEIAITMAISGAMVLVYLITIRN